MSNETDFTAAAMELSDQLVAWRRDFHMHPELSLQEHRSARVIADELSALGYQVQTGIATTGVIGLLEGEKPGPVVMVRFDMDALPITEENETDYVSQNPGVMHACGHDGHMAIGLGVATLMTRHRDPMHGALRLLFQPGEEGTHAPVTMIEEGALENPHPDLLLAAHVLNDLPVGTVDVTPGTIFASSDTWSCTVRGRSVHSAEPHHGVDPIVAAAHIVTALQSVVSRNVDPIEPAVVSIGTIHGGKGPHIIPPEVVLTGSARTHSAEVRKTILQRVQQITEGVAAACGAETALEFKEGSPPLVNDPKVAEVVRRAAEAVVGPDKTSSGHRMMGVENVAFFMEEVPGCYFCVGGANAERGLNARHHTATFDFDEDALPTTVAIMMHVLAHYLLDEGECSLEASEPAHSRSQVPDEPQVSQ